MKSGIRYSRSRRSLSLAVVFGIVLSSSYFAMALPNGIASSPYFLAAGDLSISQISQQKVEIFMPLQSTVIVSEGRLQNRVFFDLKGAQLPSGSEAISVNHPLLAQVRLAQFASDTVRIVLDVKKAITIHKEKMTTPSGGLRIELTEQGKGKKPGVVKASSKAKSKTVATKNGDNGTRVPLIAIDPGHGGDDPGAIGPKGTREKDIALEISQKLKRQLEKDLRVKAFLTRTEDVFVALEDRAKMANQKKADLFISIHCNANPKKQLRGIQTFFLDTMKDAYDRKLAARENAISLEKVSDLEMILLDLSNRENHDKSSRLAGIVHNRLIHHMDKQYSGIEDLGVRTAVFLVLFHAEMPSVLVETSFISNRDEEKRLRQTGYQEALVRAITSGVKGYIAQGEEVAGTL